MYYSLKDEKYENKIGFFIYVTSVNRVQVRRWNHDCQDFLRVSGDEENRYVSSVNNLEFDSFLG